ncbi:MAG: hypothetical protein MSC56_04705 [Clostridiales bacterium]|nr:hypothetical protein [Clostridiales bacterium]
MKIHRFADTKSKKRRDADCIAAIERFKKVFLKRSQTKTASLGFRLKRRALRCAHNFCASTKILHSASWVEFLPTYTPPAKMLIITLVPAGAKLCEALSTS